MKSVLRPALGLFIVLSLVTGLAYPALVALLGQTLFAFQASGSVIVRDGKDVGSALIGQNFSDPGHFWGRISATTPQPYNGLASGGSNLGPTNPALLDSVKGRIDALHAADPDNHDPIPVDLVTASASGLDPEISPAAASFQAGRVARVRRLPLERVQALIAENARSRTFGLLGAQRVNVLALNLALDRMN